MNRRMATALICLLMIVLTVFAPVSAYAESNVKIMKVTVDGARLREGPGNYSVLTSLKKGAKVFYTGKKGNAFYMVYTTTGRVGYVFRDYLETIATVGKDQIYYTISAANVYKNPNTKSGRAAKLSHHDFVVVYKIEGAWAAVRTLSGKAGFVKVSALEQL